jgi:hypothetical protein
VSSKLIDIVSAAVAEETRSLWEQYDSEVEPWRRGRAILVTIGCGYLISQALLAATEIASGNIEQFFVSSIGFVVFWLLFYFIWIGVHWIRWLMGAWAGAIGFCWVIWGFGSTNVGMISFGAINLLIAAYFCLSSSVYFFAKRQRETVRWKEAVGVGAVCFLLLCSIAAALAGLWLFRNEQFSDAIEFAETASEKIYVNADRNWTFSHVTRRSLQPNGNAHLEYFFRSAGKSLRSVQQISNSRGWIRLRFHFPSQFESEAYIICHAESQDGPAELHFVLSKYDNNWRIDHMWWTYLPLP